MANPQKLRARLMDAAWLQENIRCQFTCPVHTNAGGYVTLIARGRYEEAYRLAREPNPLVGICGRICAHPCETACRRGVLDQPVAICALKRFVAERSASQGPRLAPTASKKLEKVAVVGAGPAGLAAAHDLALLGYRVTVFEAQPVAGGALYLGIPEYRLPRDIIQAEVEAILALGVELKTGVALGRDFYLADLKQQGYAATFLATGATRGRELNIPGRELDGVLAGVDFLLNVNLGYRVQTGHRVVVIGGGNVAIDVARTVLRAPMAGESEEPPDLTTAVDAARAALRMGAREVHLVCLESREEMPAFAHEVAEAEREGVILHTSRGPRRILGKDGRVTALETQRVASVFDADGRFNPTLVPDSYEVLPADTVILAIGQAPDLSWVREEDGLAVTPRQTIQVDPATLATSAPGVYAGGDAAFGPRIAIAAIADGRQAAKSIHRFLRGHAEDRHPTVVPLPLAAVPAREPTDAYHLIPRQPVPTLPTGRRIGMAEVELGYDEQAARREAARCLQCFLNPWVDPGACILCGGCTDVCPYGCLKLVPLERVAADEDTARCMAGRLSMPVEQLRGSLQGAMRGMDWTVMIKDEEKCIRCGLCVERCPVGAMTMRAYLPATPA